MAICSEWAILLATSLYCVTLDVILGVCLTFSYDFLCRMWNLIILVLDDFLVICVDGREK